MKSKYILLPLLLVTLFFTAACSSQQTTSSNTLPRNSSTTPTSAKSIAQSDYTESMQEDDLTRTYYIHLPRSYQKQQAVPLVLAFHGSSSNGKSLAQETHLNDIADTGDFIVVYPDGYQGQWADGRGTTPPEQAGIDDVAFVSDLIDKLSSEFTIDQNRIYVTGMSNGGIFSERLGCELADKIAAIASVSGTMAANISEQCQPARPIPTMLFMGTSDPSVPFEGGEVDKDQGIDLSTADTIQQWVSHNECSTTPMVTQAPPAINDGTSVLRSHYGSCKDNADVVLYTIEGGIHAWPGSGNTTQSNEQDSHLDASLVMWGFFQRHHM